MNASPDLPIPGLQGARCLVTGGAGFVGSQTVDQLLAAGCAAVFVLDNMVRGRRENLHRALGSNRLHLVEGDIRDARLLDSLVDGCDIVFHQAALRITQCAQEPRAAFEVMAAATYDLLEACMHHKVRRLVYSSSASVYGMADHFPTTERQHGYDNRTLYGATKMFGEGLCRSFNEMHGLDYVALRYFNVYGPRMDIHGRYTEVLVRWMDRIAAGQAPIIFGDGLQTMDMIHVKDVACANVLAAASGATDIALNVGSGSETSLLDLAQLLARVMGRPDLVPVHEAERAVNPVPRRLACTRAARDAIGFEAAVPLEHGMAELVDWWRREKTVRQEVA
ncbi:NAD-dependent epimerase/dehydratase family protein [Roseomonas terrae]|jgi:UDP-glucose 4-epimerase|uniref:NAD-dependent epimerase/dehydratase family protein n=1 Tax=Neoroseomonas terrae TaxID=424799 RepID=A0ABS5EJ44_9PROT|nr:NAD-dependent epimerase/dehydratase family protein [Neoroseomonas terrae]MBR0651045.1 NAD-dependent epimerase/dehydratase family protein [Neoroseomonas terrae]